MCDCIRRVYSYLITSKILGISSSLLFIDDKEKMSEFVIFFIILNKAFSNRPQVQKSPNNFTRVPLLPSFRNEINFKKINPNFTILRESFTV